MPCFVGEGYLGFAAIVQAVVFLNWLNLFKYPYHVGRRCCTNYPPASVNIWEACFKRLDYHVIVAILVNIFVAPLCGRQKKADNPY